MKSLYSEEISAIYHHGSKIALTRDWHDKNVVCPNSKIYYVLDGEVCVETERERYVAKKGDAILIPAGIKHSYHLTELGYAEKYWFHFDLKIGQISYFDTLSFDYVKHLGIDESVINLFKSVVSAKDGTPARRITRLSSIYSIMAICLEDASFLESRANVIDETDAVIDYIRENYREKFTLDALAAKAKLSPNYFAKKFKERLGQPPLKYVNNLKIERAKFLLEHTDNAIGEIMDEVGFLDSAHFSKIFKLTTGYSPTKFRHVLTSRKKGLKST